MRIVSTASLALIVDGTCDPSRDGSGANDHGRFAAFVKQDKLGEHA